MDTRLIEYMLTIQEEQSISKAAERLFITPSALSQQLKKLEKEVGAPLFLRTGSEFAMTPAGQIYLSGARAVMEVKEQAMEQLQAIRTGENQFRSIRLAMHRDFYLFFQKSVKPYFERQCPSTELLPVVVENTSAKTEVAEGRADLAFIIASGITASRLRSIPIRREELHLAFPEKVDGEELAGRPFSEIIRRIRHLGFIGAPLNTLKYAEDHYLRRAGLQPEMLGYASSFPGLKKLLNQQAVCALIPACAIEKTDRFLHVPLEPEAFYLLEIVYGSSLPLTPAVKELILLFLKIFDVEHGTKNTLDALET